VGEVAGSTRKIKRQKGTGTARAGDIKNPLFRGGGRVFGPRPRSYSQKLNKKVKRLAKKSALSGKLAEGKLFVIEDFSFDSPKTKEYMNILGNLNAAGERSILVTSDYEKEVFLSSRNLQKADVVRAAELNTYQILLANSVILSEGSVETIVKSLKLNAKISRNIQSWQIQYS
jgi:large subunit ribosomal protein L4